MLPVCLMVVHISSLGAAAFQWFTNNMEGIHTSEQAKVVGQRLIDLGIIKDVQGMYVCL